MLVDQDCLLCYEPAKKSLNQLSKNGNKINGEVTAFFLLRKLLEISNSTCNDLLTSQGNPSSWFVCCSKCYAIIRKAENVFNQLLKIQSQWEALKITLESELLKCHIKKKTNNEMNSNVLGHSIREEICKRLQKEAPEKNTQSADLLQGEIIERIFETVKIELKDENIEDENPPDNDSPLLHLDDDRESSNSRDERNYPTPENNILSPKKKTSPRPRKTRSGRVVKKPQHISIDEPNSDYSSSGDEVDKKIMQSKKPKSSINKPNSDRSVVEGTGPNEKTKHNSKKLSILDYPQKSHRKLKNKEICTQNIHRFGCHFCYRSYAVKSSFTRHVTKHHLSDHSAEISPPECQYYVDIDKSLPLNIGNVTATFQCRSCENNFETTQRQYEHENVVHGMFNNFVCIVCKDLYTTETGVTMHFKEHTDMQKQKAEKRKNEKLICEDCGRIFKRESHLISHVETIHKNLRNFVCETCSQSFTQIKYMKLHQIREHNAVFDNMNLKELTCSQCGRVLSDPPALRLHIQAVHEKKYKFHCHICNAGRLSQSAMNRHVYSAHTRVKPLDCAICHETFADRVRLSVHLRIHKDQKPHKCKQCDKAFFHYTSLKKHEQIHDETIHKCNLCEKTFPSKAYLSNHRRCKHKIARKTDQTLHTIEQENALKF